MSFPPKMKILEDDSALYERGFNACRDLWIAANIAAKIVVLPPLWQASDGNHYPIDAATKEALDVAGVDWVQE